LPWAALCLHVLRVVIRHVHRSASGVQLGHGHRLVAA
jgi:hypothetical protein